MNNEPEVAAILLAAGIGTRIGADRNKLFLELNGVPILARSLIQLSRCRCINAIILVIKESEKASIENLINKYHQSTKRIEIIPGGKERADSVRNGLSYITEMIRLPEIVMTHDGARPFFSEQLVDRLVENTKLHEISIPVMPLHETIRQVEGKGSTKVIDRRLLFATQTPQVFKSRHIQRCFFQDGMDKLQLTDEGSYFEFQKIPVSLVEGETWNIKITTRDDLTQSEYLLKQYKHLQIAGLD